VKPFYSPHVLAAAFTMLEQKVHQFCVHKEVFYNKNNLL